MNGKCDICNGNVDFDNGGAALMMAFCYDHSTTMSNMAYCSECYKMFVDGPLRILSDKSGLNIPFKEESDNDHPEM